MDQAGLNFIVSNSYSKIFSLYGERVGGLTFICDDQAAAQNVLGQLKATIRRIYSNPPTTGALLVNQVLNDADLNKTWQTELAEMRVRIAEMRETLHAQLSAALPERDFSYLIKQQGMFSYTGLTAEQVDQLKDQYGIYMVRSGRICISGLNTKNIGYVANAMVEILKAA